MFEYSFVTTNRANPAPFAAACLSEAMLLAAMVVIPLVFVDRLPQQGLFNVLMLPAVPVAPPSPPPPMVAAKPIPKAAHVARAFNPNGLTSPVVVPKEVAMIDETSDVTSLDTGGMVGGVPGGIPGGIPGMSGGGMGAFGNVAALAPPPAPPAPVKVAATPAPPSAVTPRQISVGGAVQAAMLLRKVDPDYPPLAKRAHISGDVVLSAVIGADGKIENLNVVSGHPMLAEAALNAVRQWAYRPTILNGGPVEVITEIVVHFRLMS